MRASPLLVVVLLVLLGLLASSAVDARRLPKLRSQSAALGGSGVSVSTSVSVPKLAPGRQTYGHGAVMGASLEFAQHPTWATILQVLQPAAAKQVQSLLAAISADRSGSGQAVGGLMLYLENNPTLAAYGALEHLQACTGSAQSAPSACANPLRSEWDIWLASVSPPTVTQRLPADRRSNRTLADSLRMSSSLARAAQSRQPGGCLQAEDLARQQAHHGRPVAGQVVQLRMETESVHEETGVHAEQ
jgi:hypothetical protein